MPTGATPQIRFPEEVARLAVEFLLRREFKAEDYILIRDEKAQNTEGGAFTSGAWRTRDLNTEVADAGNRASLAANQITLVAGTYRFLCHAPAFFVDGHQIRLRNITAGSTIEEGTSEYIPTLVAAIQTRSFVSGRFTIAGATVLELQHQCTTTRLINGFGRANNFTTEVYAVCEFWRELL